MAWTAAIVSDKQMDKIRRLTLVSIAGAHANIANVAGLDDIMKCLHCLLDRSSVVEPMALRSAVMSSANRAGPQSTHIAVGRCSRLGDASS